MSDNGRYLRWILTLLLIFALAPIPVYIYVLEVHSANLSRIEARLARIETLLERR
jgi:hypothetical protein